MKSKKSKVSVARSAEKTKTFYVPSRLSGFRVSLCKVPRSINVRGPGRVWCQSCFRVGGGGGGGGGVVDGGGGWRGSVEQPPLTLAFRRPAGRRERSRNRSGSFSERRLRAPRSLPPRFRVSDVLCEGASSASQKLLRDGFLRCKLVTGVRAPPLLGGPPSPPAAGRRER
ncbi:hypothetical protein EYF80_016943 [Liparis tanakae]|uniref:Uncharacterized protein n=1 Tax=Liparis tanakae TaxID=230148 RepID=A0A4Z2I6B2_9TELE|nr:hypothetical protein EYF80_016943 [Liparis tanakae]